MFAFLHFIFMVFLFAVIFVLVIAFAFYRRLHSMARRFQEQMGNFGGDAQTSARRRSASGQRRRSEDKNCDETIIDERSPEEVNRKIFPKDEGEYVDFKEED